MTDKEKAKAYDEALALAKRLISNNCTEVEKLCLKCVFPELKESEDEKTRKSLVEFLTEIKDISESGRTSWAVRKEDAEMCKSFIDYLEKQKEQSITANDLDEEIHRFFDDCIEVHDAKIYGVDERVITVDCYEITARHFAKWGEKQKERNPINHNLTTWHRDVVYCAMCDESLDEGLRCNLEVVYKTIKELVDRTPVVEEQKPAEWSDEDEQRIAEIEFAVMQMNTKRVDTKDKCLAWLKSLRPQPRAKTNDYITPHKKFFKWIYNRLIDVHGENPNVDYMQSFKKRIDNLQFDEPHWKPSEEQIYSLGTVVKGYNECTVGSVGYHLKEMYEQLKKLM